MKQSCISFIIIMMLTVPTIITSSHKIPSYQQSTSSSRLHSKIRLNENKENCIIKNIKKHSKKKVLIHKKIVDSEQVKITHPKFDDYSQISNITDDNEYKSSIQSNQQQMHSKDSKKINFKNAQSICAAIDDYYTKKMNEQLQLYGITS